MKRALLAACLLCACSVASASSAEAPPLSGETAKFLSRAGLVLASRSASTDPGVTQSQRACIAGVRPESMASDYQKVLSQELPAAELAKLDAFFTSSAGHKYVDAMINDEPLDKMTLEELEYMDHEVGTASINKPRLEWRGR